MGIYMKFGPPAQDIFFFLFLALVVILFGRAEEFGQFW